MRLSGSCHRLVETRKTRIWPAAMFLALLAVTACSRVPAESDVFGIGHSASADGWRVTVHKVVDLEGMPNRQPAMGYRFCSLVVTLENSTERIRYFMPERQMVLIDSAGQEFAPDHTAAVLAARSGWGTVPDGEMSAHEIAQGSVSYQVPLRAQRLCWELRTSLLPWGQRLSFCWDS